MATTQRIGIEALDIVTVVVDGLDEAHTFYTETLGFETRMDEQFEMDGHTGRWLTVGLPGSEVQIALVAADEPYYDDDRRALMAAKLGAESGLTFRTSDCEASVAALEEAGVEITQPTTTYDWGTEAMFADPFGNAHSLFEYAEM